MLLVEIKYCTYTFVTFNIQQRPAYTNTLTLFVCWIKQNRSRGRGARNHGTPNAARPNRQTSKVRRNQNRGFRSFYEYEAPFGGPLGRRSSAKTNCSCPRNPLIVERPRLISFGKICNAKSK